MHDLISRQAAINTAKTMCKRCDTGDIEDYRDLMVESLTVLPSTQQWIPVKTRPMTDEEREHFADVLDYIPEDDEAVMFDCLMPEDKQRIWICTKCGNVFDDVCEDDDGFIGLEGNGDWDDIVAWMPMDRPEPYEGDNNG